MTDRAGNPQPPATHKPHLDRTAAIKRLRQMLRIRRFEERAAELYTQEKIRGFLHLYIGEEAVAVGVMQALHEEDAIVSTYREHGHALARGLPMDRLMAELYGKVEGVSRGRGGSMHLFDVARRFYGGSAIVGGGIPLALGLALADKQLGRERVTACFFGEGAAAEGVFHESLNLAALWRLPVLFICENNGYAMGTALERSEAEPHILRMAESHRIPAIEVDGMDPLAVEAAAREAHRQILDGGGPRFLECKTYRFKAHSMFDPQLYRDKAEIEEWKRHGPIVRFIHWLDQTGWLTADALENLEAEIASEIEAAVDFAEQGHWEPVEALTSDVECVTDGDGDFQALASGRASAAASVGQRQTETSYREALREALREAMQADERVILMGEDVGRYGGCYAVSKGLLDEFGPDRVRDTPLSENAFTGIGIGAAIGGLRPIVEIMTVNFSLLAMDQIVNNAATLRHMSGGQLEIPLVIRMAYGAGKQLAAQHSHSFETWFAHVPGLRVVAPATLADARGMLGAALADPNPVILFEHVMLYNNRGPLPENAGLVPLVGAAIRREGRDLTLIAHGGCLPKALDAARELARQGIEAEVLDLRCLRPLDDASLLASVRKTHRALIIDEAWRSGSLAAEISARLMEQAFSDFKAPVARICSAEVPIPYPRHLEQAALPQVEQILAAAKALMQTGIDAGAGTDDATDSKQEGTNRHD